MELSIRDRSELKSYFVKNAIPTESNFADFIDAGLNQKDDGIAKLPGNPLSIEALGDDETQKKALNLYRSFADEQPSWVLNLNPRSDPADPATARPGFNISDGEGKNRFFIDRSSGHVGIGTISPKDRLEVAGNLRLLTDSNPIRFTSGWSGFPDQATDQAEISNDTGTYKSLMIVGNKSGGSVRRVSIWDSLEVNGDLNVNSSLKFSTTTRQKIDLYQASYGIGVQSNTQYFRTARNFAWFKAGSHHTTGFNPGSGGTVQMVISDRSVGIGTTTPAARLQVRGGAIMPEIGNSTAAGILFPPNPAGGSGDQAWIRYYPGATERTTLEIGIGNDTYDNIALMATGNVGIGTREPNHKFHVKAGSAVGLFESTTTSAYLRLYTSQGSGYRVEVANRSGGRLALYTAGAGDTLNITRDGKVGIGTTAPAEKLHIIGSVRGSAGGGALRISTTYGYIDVGPMNTAWCHIQTDRPKFYFNKQAQAYGGFATYSSRKIKKNIRYLNTEDEENVLNSISSLRLVNYRLKDRDLGNKTHLGLIAEEAPDIVVSEGGNAIDLYDYVSYGITAMKALKRRLEDVEDRIANLSNAIM